jgi:hypothetical protein
MSIRLRGEHVVAIVHLVPCAMLRHHARHAHFGRALAPADAAQRVDVGNRTHATIMPCLCLQKVSQAPKFTGRAASMREHPPDRTCP